MIVALVATPVLGVAEAAANSGGLPDWATVLIGLIAGAGGVGGVVQLLKVRSDKKNINAGTAKSRAEAADILSETALSLVTPLREQVDRLSIQVNTLELRLVQERHTADTRIAQLEADIRERDVHIRSQSAEIIELRTRSRTGWPDAK